MLSVIFEEYRQQKCASRLSCSSDLARDGNLKETPFFYVLLVVPVTRPDPPSARGCPLYRDIVPQRGAPDHRPHVRRGCQLRLQSTTAVAIRVETIHGHPRLMVIPTVPKKLNALSSH